jgi:hypothetical protein
MRNRVEEYRRENHVLITRCEREAARLTRLRAWLEQEIARLQIRGTEWDGGYNEACERILARLGEV